MIASLSAAQVAGLKGNYLNETLINGMTSSAVSALTTAQVRGLTAGNVGALTETQVGALAATLLVFGLAHGRGGWTPQRLLLTGVVVAAGAGVGVAAAANLDNILRFGKYAPRVAFVNPPQKKILQMKLMPPEIRGKEVRFFNSGQLPEAIAWIKS